MRLCVVLSFLLLATLTLGALGYPQFNFQTNSPSANDIDLVDVDKSRVETMELNPFMTVALIGATSQFSKEELQQIRSDMPGVIEFLGPYKLSKCPSLRDVVRDILKDIHRSKPQSSPHRL